MSDNNLPVNMDEQETGGNISYANEVIAIIAGMAMSEVDGVAGRSGAKTVSQYLGLAKSGNPVTKGVRVEVGSEEASVDLTLGVEYGKPIQKVCTEVQENVRKAIETMTGLHVVKVDVHVTSVIFEKDDQARDVLASQPDLPEKPSPRQAEKKADAADPDFEQFLDIDEEIQAAQADGEASEEDQNKGE